MYVKCKYIQTLKEKTFACSHCARAAYRVQSHLKFANNKHHWHVWTKARDRRSMFQTPSLWLYRAPFRNACVPPKSSSTTTHCEKPMLFQTQKPSGRRPKWHAAQQKPGCFVWVKPPFLRQVVLVYNLERKELWKATVFNVWDALMQQGARGLTCYS